MSNDILTDNLRKFYDEMDERLKDLPPQQQQQYLEGVVHALDAVTRYAIPSQITPVEREDFIGSAKSAAYSKAIHLSLDSKTRMKGLIESDAEAKAKLYLFAIGVHKVLKMPLTMEQMMTFQQLAFMYGLERGQNDTTELLRKGPLLEQDSQE